MVSCSEGAGAPGSFLWLCWGKASTCRLHPWQKSLLAYLPACSAGRGDKHIFLPWTCWERWEKLHVDRLQAQVPPHQFYLRISETFPLQLTTPLHRHLFQRPTKWKKVVIKSKESPKQCQDVIGVFFFRNIIKQVYMVGGRMNVIHKSLYFIIFCNEDAIK